MPKSEVAGARGNRQWAKGDLPGDMEFLPFSVLHELAAPVTGAEGYARAGAVVCRFHGASACQVDRAAGVKR
jgi:hypothetical protein